MFIENFSNTKYYKLKSRRINRKTRFEWRKKNEKKILNHEKTTYTTVNSVKNLIIRV